MSIKKTLSLVAGVAILSGCAHSINHTPQSMSYDGSEVDYSKIDQMKKSTVCMSNASLDGDITVPTAAEKGGISKVKHVDTSQRTKKFLWFVIESKTCVTVYGK